MKICQSRGLFIVHMFVFYGLAIAIPVSIGIVVMRVLMIWLERWQKKTLKKLRAQRARLEKARWYLDEMKREEKKFTDITSKDAEDITWEEKQRARQLLDRMKELHAHACWLLVHDEKDEERRQELMENVMRAPNLGMFPVETGKEREREGHEK